MVEWLKAFHIMAVIAWMAGLFYLPRLFVYHSQAEAGSELSATFQIMERRLLKIIMTPAMVVTWVFGLLLVWQKPYVVQEWWFLFKFALVVALSGFHGFLAACVRSFAHDGNVYSERFYRLINEVPTVAMVGIVIAVVVKPF